MDSVETAPKTEEEKKESYNAGFTEAGFFTCFMHESKGIRELLGFLEQCKDVVKQHYIQKMKEGLVRPEANSKFLNGFRNKWRR